MKKFFFPLFIICIKASFGQTSVESFIKLGLQQHANQNYEGAILEYNKALDLDSLNKAVYVCRGNSYFELKNYSKSLADVSKVLQLDPNFAIGYNNRGLIYKFQNKYNEALLDYNKAINLDKNYFEAYINKIRVLLLLNRNKEAESTVINLKKEVPNNPESYLVAFVYCTLINNTNGAINELNTAVAMDSKNEMALNERARYFDELNDDKAAVADYTRLIQLHSTEAKYYYGRSSANYDLKNYEDVISDCKKTIMLDDNYYPAYTMLGDVYDTYGEKEKSIANYEKAISIRPNSEHAYNELSKVYYLKGDYKNSLDVLNRILEKKPDIISSLEYRASSKTKLKYYNSAIEDYNKLISMNPKNLSYYINRATVEQDANKTTDACADMKKAIGMIDDKLSEEYAYAHNFLFKNCRSLFSQKILKVDDLFNEVSDLYSQHKIDLVIKKYDEMIKIVPDSSWLYFNRGKFKRDLEKHDEAILDYKKAVQLDKKNVEAWTAMGISYMYLFQNDNAIKAFLEAIKANENYAMAYYDLGLIYAEKKEYDKAINYFELTLQKDPNYDKVNLQLGEAYLLSGNKEKACFNFKRAEAKGSIPAKLRVISECR